MNLSKVFLVFLCRALKVEGLCPQGALEGKVGNGRNFAHRRLTNDPPSRAPVRQIWLKAPSDKRIPPHRCAKSATSWLCEEFCRKTRFGEVDPKRRPLACPINDFVVTSAIMTPPLVLELAENKGFPSQYA